MSDDLRTALEQCRDQFRFYEREHQAKADNHANTIKWRIDHDMFLDSNLDTERDMQNRAAKAATNRRFADMCDAALTAAALRAHLGASHDQ